MARLTQRLEEAEATALGGGDGQRSGSGAAADAEGGAHSGEAGAGVGQWQATAVSQLEQEVADLTSRLAAADAEVAALRSASKSCVATALRVLGQGGALCVTLLCCRVNTLAQI